MCSLTVWRTLTRLVNVEIDHYKVKIITFTSILIVHILKGYILKLKLVSFKVRIDHFRSKLNHSHRKQL